MVTAISRPLYEVKGGGIFSSGFEASVGLYDRQAWQCQRAGSAGVSGVIAKIPQAMTRKTGRRRLDCHRDAWLAMTAAPGVELHSSRTVRRLSSRVRRAIAASNTP